MYEIAERLRAGHSHALMSKALELLTGSATEQLKVTLDLLERVIGAVDWGPIRDVNNVARPGQGRVARALALLLAEINTSPPTLPGDGRPITYALRQSQ
jgi:hypothetical protein